MFLRLKDYVTNIHPGSQVEFVLETQDDPYLTAELSLRHAVINIVENGIKAAAQKVEVRVSSREGSRLEILVTDDGPGIPTEVMEKMGEPFISTRKDSMGLGIFLANAAVQRLGGEIEMYNLKQGGATTLITFPLSLGQSTDMSVDKTPQQLLLVEDDEVFARVLSKALGRRGYEVRYAPDLSLALQLVEQEQFDLAILDLNLGGATSMELIKPLKQSNPEIRMLILTGYASIATAVEAIKLGADNYLAKPADTDEILASLLNREQLDKQEPDSDGVLATMSVKRLEWEHIQKTLQANNGNISATARQLNMHRRTLQRKLQKRPVRT